MAVTTTSVTMNSGSYTVITTANTGYALVGNPADAGDDLLIFIGTSAPVASTKARFILAPGEYIQRTSDIDNHLYGKCANADAIEAVITQ